MDLGDRPDERAIVHPEHVDHALTTGYDGFTVRADCDDLRIGFFLWEGMNQRAAPEVPHFDCVRFLGEVGAAEDERVAVRRERHGIDNSCVAERVYEIARRKLPDFHETRF